MAIVVDEVEYTAAKVKAMDEGEYEHLLSRAKLWDGMFGTESAAELRAARGSKKVEEDDE